MRLHGFQSGIGPRALSAPPLDPSLGRGYKILINSCKLIVGIYKA
jgi:hypothetical protein